LQVDARSVVEFCRFLGESVSIGANCLISDCESSQSFAVPPETLIFTLAVNCNRELGFLCAAFRISDDLKKAKKHLQWFARTAWKHEKEERSLWEVALFEVWSSRERALHSTLHNIHNEHEINASRNAEVQTHSHDGHELISLEEALRRKNTHEILSWRSSLRR
jgi:hypothetical protein